jgi:hypothetical protein
VQERLAERVSDQFDLRVTKCPGTSQAIVEALWWCDDHDDDPAHGWLRQALVRVASESGGLRGAKRARAPGGG